jgi:hypothetical protein
LFLCWGTFILALHDDSCRICVMRIAESVVLTCCPPARRTGTYQSSIQFIHIYLDIVVNLGMTSRSERCMRLYSRHRGKSARVDEHALTLKKSVRVFSLMRTVAFFIPLPHRSIINCFRCESLKFAHRVYMRSSILAQSCDSVPPAPG